MKSAGTETRYRSASSVTGGTVRSADFGNNVLAAPKHKGGEQGNQTTLIHTEPSLLRLKGTAQNFIRTSEKNLFSILL